ncbi:MAG: fused MFS/spermidine synthase [Pseudomonadales bacterium]|nr:fused MFS/spermidine synthase [Pseudomonadales bacterium]
MHRTHLAPNRWIATTFALLALALSIPSYAKVLHEERSVYTRIIVEDERNLRCLKFTLVRENSRQTCMDRNNPQRLVFDYAKMTLSALLLKPDPERILIIGLGGGTLPMALRDILPSAVIDTVEIDEAVVRVAKRFFDFAEDDQNRVYVQDARVFGKRATLRGEQYDLIILDAFDGEYIPEHLMTVEFLSEMRGLLSDDGVLVANTFASSKLYDYESATYAEAFGGFLNFRLPTSGNRVILVPQAKLDIDARTPLDLETLRANAEALKAPMAPYDMSLKRYVSTLLSLSEQKPDWNTRIRPLTDQFSPANVLQSQ